jgi:hypothetical protein
MENNNAEFANGLAGNNASTRFIELLDPPQPRVMFQTPVEFFPYHLTDMGSRSAMEKELLNEFYELPHIPGAFHFQEVFLSSSPSNFQLTLFYLFACLVCL